MIIEMACQKCNDGWRWLTVQDEVSYCKVCGSIEVIVHTDEHYEEGGYEDEDD